MSAYIIGIVAVLVGTLLHACANIIDNYLSEKLYRRLTSLIFFTSAINIALLVPVVIFNHPGMFTRNSIFLILLISCTNVFYQYPYFKALRSEDTSVVTSLFSLAKILTPLLAFLMVGEHLVFHQYVGFFLIILSSVFLTFDIKKLRFTGALMLMLIVSLLLTLQSILYKKLYEEITWSTTVFWTTIFDLVISYLTVIVLNKHHELKLFFRTLKKNGGIIVLNQGFTWGGEVVGIYALKEIPVSVFEGISSTQPVFVLLIALFFMKRKPEFFRELIDKHSLVKKLVLFVIMLIGAVLIT